MELNLGYGAVLGTVTGVSLTKGSATVEDATGHTVAIPSCNLANIGALGARFGKLVIIIGAATYSKGGRLVSVVPIEVRAWDAPSVAGD
jgi:hypothetical protein